MQAELRTRILSAAVLAPIVLGLLYVGGIPFMLLMLACFMLMYREWLTITKPSPKRRLWAAWGFIYIGVPCAALVWFSREPFFDGTLVFLIWYVLAIVWATDIGAYFVGRKWGKHKIAPAISPKKSWEGLAGGVTASVLACTALHAALTPDFSPDVILIGLAALLAVVAQIGDFYESWIKRKFGVKDSGSLIPGHGGLLDRMDGILSVTWAITLLWAVFG